LEDETDQLLFQRFQKPGKRKYNDIANFYISYLERHWVIEKALAEITLKSTTAKERYLEFENDYPDLISRLKTSSIALILLLLLLSSAESEPNFNRSPTERIIHLYRYLFITIIFQPISLPSL
jgi:hypothetical protein